jgi:selenocysteine lyase/cysteine desulfurase
MRLVSTIEQYQATFDLEPGYLDWAAFGPLSPTVREESAADLELLGTGRRSSIEHVAEHAEAATELIARMLGARADAVTLQPSTTDALMHAAFGVTGDVVLSRLEFSSLTVAVSRAAEALHAATAQWVDPPAGFMTPEVVRDALTPETRAVAVSLVDYRTGYRADLAALRDVIGDRLLIVDAIQGFGVVEADYAAADVVCGSGYTWLRAGRGTGFAWFSDRAIEHLVPVFSGRTDIVPGTGDVPPPVHAASAFTVSPPDQIAAARLTAALREVGDVGVPAIEQALAERTRDVLFLAERHGLATVTPREPARRAGIVALAPDPADVATLAASLSNHGITCTVRAGLVRLSPHVGTGGDSFLMLGDALAAFAQARSW